MTVDALQKLRLQVLQFEGESGRYPQQERPVSPLLGPSESQAQRLAAAGNGLADDILPFGNQPGVGKAPSAEGAARAAFAARHWSARRSLASAAGTAASTLAILVLGAFVADTSAAREVDEVPFEITADSIEVDAVQRLYIAEGHVRIVQQEAGRSLAADWVVFSKSYNAMITTREVSLKAEISILTVGGITIFNAWGRITSRMVW